MLSCVPRSKDGLKPYRALYHLLIQRQCSPALSSKGGEGEPLAHCSPSAACKEQPPASTQTTNRATLRIMAWPRLKTAAVAAAAILLATGIAVVVTMARSGSFSQGRLRLPVGNGTPAISLGDRHGLILASDGSLWSWGSDFLGWPVLGLGDVPPQTRLRRIGNETNWISISAGTAHNLAIKSDGTLWAWGQNLLGQFGVGPPDRKHAAVYAPVHAAPGNDWKQAVAGGIHSVALKNDGTLWAWGHNWAGCLGTGSTSNSAVPVQVGSSTNWVRVWAGILETVALQSDGSLWYWGENPDPAFPQGTGQTLVPTRVSPDTNWVDVGFGVNTVFAIKSDGTLWTWGRNAHAYTDVQDPAQDTTPTRVGTNSDWQSIPACGLWWCQGLTRKDGSLWLMDASDGEPNGPRPPYKPVRFRRAELQKDVVAYAAGSAHAAAPFIHAPIGVALTRDGEVWAWGLMLGDPRGLASKLEYRAVQLANRFGYKGEPPNARPVIRQAPWQLQHLEP
jgi:alpha-tubulin suppressor-like RCC1 family protein